MICSVTTAEIALTGATALRPLGLKPADERKCKLLSWGIYFDGVSVTEAPVVVSLKRDSNTSGQTGTALTEQKYDLEQTQTITCVAVHTVTANYTDGGILQTIEVHPQAGYEKAYVPGREVMFGGGTVNGIYWEVTAPSAVNCVMFAEWDE